MKRPTNSANKDAWFAYACKLERDIKAIKLIMKSDLRNQMECYFHYGFNDEELTKIDWYANDNKALGPTNTTLSVSDTPTYKK